MGYPDVTVPGLGVVRWGRIASSCAIKTPWHDSAFLAGLPDPPETVDYTQNSDAQVALHNDYLNLTIGDCGVAAGYHIIGQQTANAGNFFNATDPQVLANYTAVGQTYPPYDYGADTLSNVAYWVREGFADKSRILGVGRLDPTNTRLVKTALWLFQNLDLGATRSIGWRFLGTTDGFEWGMAGDARPDDASDHIFSAHGYSAAGLKIVTWGHIGTLTWDALSHFFTPPTGVIGDCYVFLTQDQVAHGDAVAPNGFTWDELIAKFNGLFGTNIRRQVKRGRTWRHARASG